MRVMFERYPPYCGRLLPIAPLLLAATLLAGGCGSEPTNSASDPDDASAPREFALSPGATAAVQLASLRGVHRLKIVSDRTRSPISASVVGPPTLNSPLDLPYFGGRDLLPGRRSASGRPAGLLQGSRYPPRRRLCRARSSLVLPPNSRWLSI
jgi:hypothetical protein